MRFTKYYYMAVYIVAPDVLVHPHANRTNRSLRFTKHPQTDASPVPSSGAYGMSHVHIRDRSTAAHRR
jgi:hypothetical protein